MLGTRRNLRLPSSSDEDDEPSRNTEPAAHSPRMPLQNVPMEISDDEFVDVEEALSEHSPTPVSVQNPGATANRAEASADDFLNFSSVQIDEFLRSAGLGLRRAWLASCMAGMIDAFPGFEGFDIARKARACFEQFLNADMNYCGAGILPENVHCMHNVELEGPFVLQVDEAINISCSLRERYHDSPASSKRCLKLSLSDGVQHVFGMEYRPIHDLKVLLHSGLKIILRNIQIQRGLLLLFPEVVEVLGGVVENLDAARLRLITEVNKPPRGKRKQALLPLCQRATLAAWPSNTVSSNEANTFESNINYNGSQANISMPFTLSDPCTVHDGRISSSTVTERPYAVEVVGFSTKRDNVEDQASRDNIRNLNEEFVNANENFAELPNYDNSLTSESHLAIDVAEDVQEGHTINEDGSINELNSPVILTGEKEIPFTYLACMLAKFVVEEERKSVIQGRIKCILTGVKRFQFKHRSTYELIVYVDDGSYISEISIDHNVVQSRIGYSPEDVATALSSSNKIIKSDMTDAMKKYQLFLSMFEGTMLVEISKDFPCPVGRQMNQGCSVSDAWLLLRRLRSFTSPNLQHGSREPIILSP